MHGGTVQAHSAGLGHGSEFVIRLPLSIRKQQTMTPEDEPDAEKSSRKKLLVVDDNPDAAKSLAMLLRLSGHEVQMVHSGQAAIETATAYLPDVIFLDIGMPGMDGYEVARAIRKNPELSKIVLAALTGWGQEEDRRRTAEAGFDHHLVKPIEPQLLESLLGDFENGKPDGR
jgi:CheY-like chemotaxis protein